MAEMLALKSEKRLLYTYYYYRYRDLPHPRVSSIYLLQKIYNYAWYTVVTLQRQYTLTG